MKRMLWFAVLAVLLWSSMAMAANSIVVQSDTVALNATGVTIGVFVTNDVELLNYVIPLELRSTDGGAFITNMKRSYPAGTRLDGKITNINIANWHDGNTIGTCKQSQAGGYTTIINQTQDAFFAVVSSPEAVMFTRGAFFLPGLPAGTDGATPQILLTVDVNGSNGMFEIDTTCTNPANHLVYAYSSTGKIIPTFTKGVITVGTPVPPNSPPVPRDTSWATGEDTAKVVAYLPASDPDAGQTLTFITLTYPLNGSLGAGMDAGTGAFTYTPNPNYCGQDSLQFMVCDDAADMLCEAAWVRITVNCVNDAPIARDTSWATNQDVPRVVTYLPASDVDAGQTKTFTILSSPAHGSLGATFVPGTGGFTYTPAAGYSGPDSLKFTVCDNGAPVKCDTGTVRITVTAVNHPPVARDTLWSTNQDTPKPVAYLPASDPDAGQVLTYAILSGPAHGGISGFNTATGAFTYTPTAGYSGPDSLKFTVCDNGLPSTMCDTGRVQITVVAVNNAPVARDTSWATSQDTPKPVTYLPASDVDAGQVLTFAILSGPSHGSLGATFAPATGAFTYTPTTGYTGPDSLKFTVCDNGAPSSMCDTGTVRITVTAVNHPPNALCSDRTVNAGPACTAAADINNGSNDPDAGDVLTYAYLPVGPYPKGATSVRLIVTDNLGLADTCQANVTVQDVTPPTITCPANLTARTAPGRCDTTITFSGVRAATASDNCSGLGAIVYTSPGITISGNPPSGVFLKGVSTITATVTDGSGNSASCQFTVTVSDLEKPAITCPGNINANNDPGQCSAVVSYTASASDNCAPPPTVIGTPPSGSIFPVGTTPVWFVATDAAGNKDSCTFNVVVHDTTKPVITCPADIPVNVDAGQCGAVVTFAAPGASDNCSVASVVSVPPSGTLFPVGNTLVTSTATDASGNQKTCTFHVIVTDNEKPTVVCPGTIVVTISHGQTTAVVNYSPTIHDNCPGVASVLTPPSGSTFPVGSTDVKCVVTDASGNKDSCTFQVSVSVGNSAPAIDPIAPQSVNEGSNLTFPIAAHDLDGDAGITLSMLDNPGGANFTDNGSGSGTFDWTPSCAQGGSVYNVKFVASDGSMADTETVAITVADIPELLVATPSSVAINYQIGAPLPTPITVDLSDPGCSGMFAWQAVSSQPWLTSDADTGTTHSTVHLTVNPAGLSVGDYDATMTFGARVAEKTTFVGTNVVQVHLHVGPAPHDSVWVTSGSGKIGDTVAVDVNFCNNHLATGISVGLKYSSYNMHVVGASFVGSRVEALGAKSATLDPSNRTICLSAIPFPPEPLIAEGCGLLATLYFVYDSTGSCPNPESTMIESFIVPPGCETMLADTIPAAVYPSFVPGFVHLICPPRVCGVVKNASDDLLGDATVQLWSSYPSGTLISSVATGPDGAFCFLNLESDGPFDLRIFRNGYCTKILSGVVPTGVNSLDVVLDMLPVVKTTPHVAWYWSENAMLDGILLAPGDVITAVDPDGIVCGKTVVDLPGRYNIYVMGDDPTSLAVDEGAEAGDLITFYLNCACGLSVPGQWAATLSGTQFDANFDCGQKALEVPLCDSWTLFSFNVTPANPSPAAVLSSIVGEYQIVFTSTCAGPLSWDANRPFNDLTAMDPYHGYWLKTTGPGVGPIAISGVPVPTNTPIDLCEGWNLVSYLPDLPDTFTHALNSIDGQYSHIFGFECGDGFASWDAKRPAFLNDIACMKPMLGYWIKTTVPTTLNYPTGGYQCNDGSPILSKPVNLLARVSQTPYVTDFWSITSTNTSGLRAGDRLTVRNPAGVICGECVAGSDGAFMVHVYGDDPATASQVEGAVEGEALQFEINDVPATVQSGSAIWSERQSTELTVAAKSSPVPSSYALLQNYPNPFNPSTIIKFRLPVATDAKLTIFNVLGQTVRVLMSGSLSEGEHSFEWNGQNESGQAVQSGIYFYRLDTPSWSDVKKMTFLK